MSRDCNLIKLKRGLANEWSSLNPVLKLGEPGYEKDTKKLKIGDGVTLWNDLPYIGSGTIDFEDVQDEVANFLTAGSNIFLDYDDPNNILTISATGLQPSGNYATLVGGLVPESQLPSYVDDVLEFINLASFPSPGEVGKIYVALDTNKTYRWSGSTYIEISSGPSSSDDVPEGSGNLYYTNDRVNDLLKAGSYIDINYDSVNLTISVTGLQPSGDYSVVGHSHVSSDITDFNNSVSGLISVVNISQGSGILVSENNKDFTITSDGSYIQNIVQDNFNTSLIEGSGISLNYDSINETLTISATGLQPSGNYSLVGHTHTSSEITDFNSSVSGLIPIQQLVGVSGISVSSSGTTRQIGSNFIAGNGIAFNYNNDESLTISTITNNGIIPINDNSTTSLTIPDGYVVGSLSIYQNGVKLLDGIDYVANDGSGITFTNVPTSGSYIEYGSPTFSSSIQNLINIVYDTSIYDLGNVSGSVNIDYSIDKQIQTLTLNGTTVTLNKGSGWPTTNISRDVVLQIVCNSATTIVWNIVGNNWYNKPTSILPGGEYLILLRSIGSSVIQGHYIGNKQGSL